MKFSRFVPAAFLMVFSIIFVSCSGTSQITGKKGQISSVYPEWYKAERPFVPDTNSYRGYATALAGDSASAAQKAVAHAQEELKSGISRKLESIRKEAADEPGSSSGLSTPGFIVTLRNAETDIINAFERANVEVSSNKAYSGYRGFAEAAVNKKALLRELDRAMERYETVWNTMKESRAFAGF